MMIPLIKPLTANTKTVSCLLLLTLVGCADGAFAQAPSDSATQRSAVSSQKRSSATVMPTLHAQAAKMDHPDDGTDRATMASDAVLNMSPDTSTTFLAQAEQALSAGHIDYAIKVARRCLEEDSSDIDGRLVLARALTAKYRAQDDKQTSLLKECLEQYLYVARHGENDTFQTKTAQQKMYDLTGIRWHPWISQKAYMKKALQGDGLVAGNVVKGDTADDK